MVEKSGAWFSYDSQRIGQGRENAKTFLKANPDIAGKIEAAIRQNAGLIARNSCRRGRRRRWRRRRGGRVSGSADAPTWPTLAALFSLPPRGKDVEGVER